MTSVYQPDEKQIVRILDAVYAAGAATSCDISDLTGLPLKTCSSYLSALREDGLLEIVGQLPPNGRGAKCNVYAPAGKAIA